MIRTLFSCSLVITVLTAPAASAAPSVEDALKLKPVQSGIDFDQPSDDEIARSSIKAEKVDGATAWVVRGPDGLTLREFADGNGDNVVDRWSYFRDGIEVYRDVDGDYDGKADRFCWLQTGGARVGVDKNKDGALDEWQRLSAEEAAEEAVLALRTGDKARFTRLVLTTDDVKSLKVAESIAKRLQERIATASDSFAELAKSGKLAKDAQFSDFGGLRPGAVPAGSRGAADDLIVYENAWAMVRNGDDHQQMQLGTMIRVGDVWKFIDAPSLSAPGDVTAGFFFDNAGAAALASAPADESFAAPSDAVQELLAKLEQLDAKLGSASPAQQTKLNEQRAGILEKLAEAAGSPSERDMWLMYLADTISSAAQMGTFEDGLERLAALEKKLAADKASDDLLAHVAFRRMQAAYTAAMSESNADTAKIQEAWIEQLKRFVGKYKGSDHVAEALLQLAMASEFAGDAETAQQWYKRIVADFPKNERAAKAKGALARLSSVGRAISLTGAGLDGGQIDLRQYRGKAVLVYFWSTTLPTLDADHETMADMLAKYGGRSFDVIGVNLDGSRAEVQQYLKDKRLPWKQIYEPGGFESRLANEFGVITMPLMILTDPTGKVVNNNLQAAELPAELKKALGGNTAISRAPTDRRRD